MPFGKWKTFYYLCMIFLILSLFKNCRERDVHSFFNTQQVLLHNRGKQCVHVRFYLPLYCFILLPCCFYCTFCPHSFIRRHFSSIKLLLKPQCVRVLLVSLFEVVVCQCLISATPCIVKKSICILFFPCSWDVPICNQCQAMLCTNTIKNTIQNMQCLSHKHT